MFPNFRIATLDEVITLLPAASSYRCGSAGTAHAYVLVCEGDGELPELNLNNPIPADSNVTALEAPVLLLVTGSLVIHGPIHSDLRSHGCNLMVLGNVQAHSLIVGKQEIHVGGQLQIKQLFWGHGEGHLLVEGCAQARLWIASAGYTLTAQSSLTGEEIWHEHSQHNPPPPLCRKSLETRIAPTFVSDAALNDPLTHWLHRELLITAACQNAELLASQRRPLTYPPRLRSAALTAANLQALLETPLHTQADEHAQLTMFDGDTVCRLTFYNHPDHHGAMGLESPNAHYVLSLQGRHRGLLDRLIKKTHHSCTLKIDLLKQSHWHTLSETEIEQDEALHALWQQWLALIANAEREWSLLTHYVTPERVVNLLDMPQVRQSFPAFPRTKRFGTYSLNIRPRHENPSGISIAWPGIQSCDNAGSSCYCVAQFDLADVLQDESAAQQLSFKFLPEQNGSQASLPLIRFPARIACFLKLFTIAEDLLVSGQQNLGHRNTPSRHT